MDKNTTHRTSAVRGRHRSPRDGRTRKHPSVARSRRDLGTSDAKLDAVALSVDDARAGSEVAVAMKSFDALTAAERAHAFCEDDDVARATFVALVEEVHARENGGGSATRTSRRRQRTDESAWRCAMDCMSACAGCLEVGLALRREMDEEAARTSAWSAETWGRFDFERLERGFDVYSCEDRIQDEYTRRCALQNALREIMLAPGPLREGRIYKAGSDAFNACFDAGTSDDGDEDARVLMEEIWTTPCGSFPGVFAMLADSSSKTRKKARALLTEREAGADGTKVVRSVRAENARRELVEDVLGFWIECLAIAQMNRESGTRITGEEPRNEFSDDASAREPDENRMWFALAYTFEMCDNAIVRDVIGMYPVLLRVTACAIARANDDANVVLSRNASEVMQQILFASPKGPIAAKSFWRRMAVRPETFINDVYEAARLVKGIDEAQRVALNILKLVYMLLLTGDAVSARKIMEILVAEVPQASYMFSPLIQWESRLMGCDAVKAQYSEIGVDDAVLTLSDWNERIGTDMIKSLQSDDDVSPEVCEAREKLSITFMSTMGYIICADAIAISALADPAFFDFTLEQWAREHRIKGDNALGELHMKILKTLRTTKRWKVNTRVWKYALGFDRMSPINSNGVGNCLDEYVGAVMYAMGLIAPFAREDQSKPPLQVQYNYVEITEGNQENANALRQILSKCGEWFFKSLLTCPIELTSTPPLERSNDEPKCTEGAVMCILSQRQSLVSIAGEVLKKHYGADSKEQCYKQMFQDLQQTAVPKAVLGAIYCALKDVKRMPTNTPEGVDEFLRSASSPILQTHQIINAIDSDDKERLMAFSWYFSKVAISSVGIFEVMSAHGLKCTLSEHESLYNMLLFLRMYWTAIKERKQDGDFDKEKPLNILQNLLAWEPAKFVSSKEDIDEVWVSAIDLLAKEFTDSPSSARIMNELRDRVQHLLSADGVNALSQTVRSKLANTFSVVLTDMDIDEVRVEEEKEEEEGGEGVIELPDDVDDEPMTEKVPPAPTARRNDDPSWLLGTDKKKRKMTKRGVEIRLESAINKAKRTVAEARTTTGGNRKQEKPQGTYNKDTRKKVAPMAEVDVPNVNPLAEHLVPRKQPTGVPVIRKGVVKGAQKSTTVEVPPPPAAVSSAASAKVNAQGSKFWGKRPLNSSSSAAPAAASRPISVPARQAFKVPGARRQMYRPEDIIRNMLCLTVNRLNRDEVQTDFVDMNLVEMNTHLEDRPPTVFHGPQEYKDHFVPLIVAELRSDIKRALGASDLVAEEVRVMSTQIEVDTLSTVSFKLNDESKKPFRSDDFVMIEPIVSADAFTMSQDDELSLSRKQKQKSYIFGWVESVPSVHNDQALVIKTFFGGKGGTLRLGEIQKTLQRKNARFGVKRLLELTTVLRELRAVTNMDGNMFKRIREAPRTFGPMYPDQPIGIRPRAYKAIKSSLNAEQLKAVVGTCARQFITTTEEREAPVLIVGPPGTGKTHLIVNIVAALLNGEDFDGNPTQKRIICATQSNNAVDEIVTRLVDGSPQMGSRLNALLKGVNVVRIGSDDKIKEGSASARRHVRRLLLDGGVDIDEMEENVYARNSGYYKNQLNEIKDKRNKIEKRLADETRRVQSRSRSYTGLPGSVQVPNTSPELERMRNSRQEMFQLQDEIEKKFRDKLKEEGRSGGSVVPSTPFDRVINQANVVCGTLSSMAHLAKKQSSRNNTTSPNCGVDLFDVVIIDEASQAVEPATLIPLQWLKPDGLIVLVGDCQQLRPTVISRAAIKAHYAQSLFERLQKTGLPSFTLQEQYRMHPSIVRFPNLRFYRERLTSGKGCDAADRLAPYHSKANCGPYQFFNVKRGQMVVDRYKTNSNSYSNSLEAEFASYCYKHIAEASMQSRSKHTVGVITPYLDQVKRLNEFIGAVQQKNEEFAEWAPVTYGTVDQMQGHEFDAVLISCVRARKEKKEDVVNTDVGFLKDERRLNVALTRARKSTWIIGCVELLSRENVWNDLKLDAERRFVLVECDKAPYDEVFSVAASKMPHIPDSAHPTQPIRAPNVRPANVIVQAQNDPRKASRTASQHARRPPGFGRKGTPANNSSRPRSREPGEISSPRNSKRRKVASQKPARKPKFIPEGELSD